MTRAMQKSAFSSMIEMFFNMDHRNVKEIDEESKLWNAEKRVRIQIFTDDRDV